MTTIPSRFPLCWPTAIPRSKSREPSRFKTTLPSALDNVEKSLQAFGKDSRTKVTNIIMSSNVTLGAASPADAGVAVWFMWGDDQVCIPVDRYITVAANLQAIHHILEARRTELRHGTLALVRASMQGFKMLPAPYQWHEVLGVAPTATRAEIEEAYKARARSAHPDLGGTQDDMAKLNDARAQGLHASS